MTLFLISFMAGVLTVLAPCILPLLPVVIGSSVGARSKSTPFIVIGSLALSILLFTYLLKASTALITIPPYVWSYLSGGILVGFGLVLMFPKLWESLPFVAKTSVGANKLMGAGHQKKSVWGDVLVGAALGPVFSTCSPTYFVILATVLPASFLLGTVYLLAYIAGLVLVLALIAVLGQKLIAKLQIAADNHSPLKKIIGLLFVLVGIFIITGLDKKLETKILDSGYLDISRVELKLLDTFEAESANSKQEESNETSEASTPETTNSEVAQETTGITEPEYIASKNVESASVPIDVPSQLKRLFPDTDFSKADQNLENALSGGPTKDGIPALNNPTFVSLSSTDWPDSVQAIVLTSEEEVRVYPYNILVWHEIVNDTFDDKPIAVTFCPLCGSAIVYDRTLPSGLISTFGVSGSLLESNMIMYDRVTENLWQQSTGKTLAGSLFPAKLELVPFQLFDLGTIRQKHQNAMILSAETGYSRNYGHNPYAGYETDDRFVSSPSELDTTLDPKTIVVVFRTTDDIPVAAPWLELRAVNTATKTINDVSYTLAVTDAGELTITDQTGVTYPFYFEMWFSFAVQHGDTAQLINP